MNRLCIISLCFAYSYAQLAYINLTQPYLIPESMDFDSSFGYLVGSIGAGNVRKVDPNTGAVSILASSANMIATFGVQVDKRGGRHRLLVCSGIYPPNATAPFQAGVAVIDLTIASPVQTNFYDLTSYGPGGYGRLCNDMVSDDAGNIYATDSFGFQLWKITSLGAISSYISNPAWQGSMTSPFGTDGIELTSEGNLIVGHLSDTIPLSTLWLVNTTTVNFTQITITGGNVLGADGIYFSTAGCLYVVGAGKVNRLKSLDQWHTARVLESISSPCVTPTAIAQNGVDFYVSCANNFGIGPAAIAKVTFTATESAALCTGPDSSTSSTGGGGGGSGSSDSSSVHASFAVALSVLFLIMTQ